MGHYLPKVTGYRTDETQSADEQFHLHCSSRLKGRHSHNLDV